MEERLIRYLLQTFRFLKMMIYPKELNMISMKTMELRMEHTVLFLPSRNNVLLWYLKSIDFMATTYKLIFLYYHLGTDENAFIFNEYAT